MTSLIKCGMKSFTSESFSFVGDFPQVGILLVLPANKSTCRSVREGGGAEFSAGGEWVHREPLGDPLA